MRARRIRIGEIAAEALQEAQQKRAEAKANQEVQKEAPKAALSSTSSQSGSIQPTQVDTTSTKRTREELPDKVTIRYKKDVGL